MKRIVPESEKDADFDVIGFLDRFRGIATEKTPPTEEELKALAEEFVKDKNRSRIFKEYGLE